MAYEEIVYGVADRICTITLNRPERLNAYTQRMCYELQCAFDDADADDDVRALIVTGAGRAFCAGADLQSGADVWSKNPAASGGEPRDDDRRKYKFVGDSGGLIARRIYECNKPVIAAINGPAVGVGLTMTLPMDIRLAATNTKMGFVFAARGIVPEACSTWFLPRLVGVSRAAEWFYSARVFRSEEALQAGLIRSLHEPGDVVTEARKLAREFIDNSSAVSIAMTRQLLWRMLGHPSVPGKAQAQLHGPREQGHAAVLSLVGAAGTAATQKLIPSSTGGARKMPHKHRCGGHLTQRTQ
jgi:enoyl-CoA hydratase/carnithine racemase